MEKGMVVSKHNSQVKVRGLCSDEAEEPAASYEERDLYTIYSQRSSTYSTDIPEVAESLLDSVGIRVKAEAAIPTQAQSKNHGKTSPSSQERSIAVEHDDYSTMPDSCGSVTPSTPASIRFPSSNRVHPISKTGSSGESTHSGRTTPSGSVTPQSLSTSGSIVSLKHQVMVNYLFQKQCARMWISPESSEIEGVLLRKSRGDYSTCPPQLVDSAFGHACDLMNLQSAMTVKSRVIGALIASAPTAVDIPLQDGLRMQVLQFVEDLPQARKHQCGAFIASEGVLVVWDDDPRHLIERAATIESQIMKMTQREMESINHDLQPETCEKEVSVSKDTESGVLVDDFRPTNLLNSTLVACCLGIVVILLGLALRSLAVELAVDHQYLRLAFLCLIPIQIFFTLFFAQVIVGCISQCCGPVKQLQSNSKYYSAKCSKRLKNTALPHVTIQCPVYKEGLEGVIIPTVVSIKEAISTYELQGGSANMFVNDDGLQIIDKDEANARINFYADNEIGWTARPRHGENGFVRKGKFKKASNMNYGLMLSCAVEEKLASFERLESWSAHDEAAAYDTSLREVLDEYEGRAWAEGNIRVGDYILLIDSDTRVPSDCLLDAVSEMEQSPSVAILQFSSGVMQVVNTYFENGITFFTNLVYTAIRYTVANGDVAPFVGHNAILRWNAIQQVSYTDEDGYEKFWSESHVSEDFDMSLRLQCHGYLIRLAAWAGNGFKEGVSLTVYDELARWEKYAYGCNELLFHPIRKWIYKGPFTPLFRRFLFSNIRLTSKITIISYIGTYYAIGAAWIMTLANYFAVGWYNGYLDKYYIDSWKVWFSIVIVFNGLGNIALAVMRYRVSEKSFFSSLLENFKWIPLLAIFLGGLSLHVSSALLAHMFEIDMTWGATAKEAEFSNFFIEVPKVLRKFKYSIAFAITSIVGMVVLSSNLVPWDWQIKDFIAILPLSTISASHLLLPIALNPSLMSFTF